MIKNLLLSLSLVFAFSLSAKAACTSFNTTTYFAREAVKALIALSDSGPAKAYYGGVSEEDSVITIVRVQPHFISTLDSYRVSVRKSDCKVLNVTLVAEKLPLDSCRAFGPGCE